MDGISERVSVCISKLGLKKKTFAEKLGVSAQYISQLCSGAAGASDRTIRDICRIFGVNEVWLRTGDGEIFKPRTQQEEIASFVGSILREDGDNDFQRALLAVMARTTPDEWVIFKRKLDELSAEIKKNGE